MPDIIQKIRQKPSFYLELFTVLSKYEQTHMFIDLLERLLNQAYDEGYNQAKKNAS